MCPTNKTTTKNLSQSQCTPNYVLSYSENTIKYVWHNLLIIKYDYAEQINPFGIAPDNFKGTVFEQIDCEIILHIGAEHPRFYWTISPCVVSVYSNPPLDRIICCKECRFSKFLSLGSQEGSSHRIRMGRSTRTVSQDCISDFLNRPFNKKLLVFKEAVELLSYALNHIFSVIKVKKPLRKIIIC
jgi:hypothetical protein